QCCVGLMAILLVIGVMNVLAMAVVAAAITVERLAPAGERVARATGAAALGAGVFLIVRAAGLGWRYYCPGSSNGQWRIRRGQQSQVIPTREIAMPLVRAVPYCEAGKVGPM